MTKNNGLLLGVPSVVLYIVIPVILAQILRKVLLVRGQAAFDAAMAKIGPWSITSVAGDGALRPTQGKTLAVMQVSGGSQSFNAVNQMRVLDGGCAC